MLRVYPSDHSDGAASVYTDAKMEGFYAQYNDFYSKSSYGKSQGSCDLIASHLVLSCGCLQGGRTMSGTTRCPRLRWTQQQCTHKRGAMMAPTEATTAPSQGH